MDSAPEIATTLEGWLRHFATTSGNAVFREIGAPNDPCTTIPALAALAAEALARDRTLWIATADDTWLPDISNALDLRLRPLCLVQPGADYAGHIALRATLSLLKSRLARAADDSDGPAWSAMRQRLYTADALWREALAWSKRGLTREAPPPEIATLFPVRIGPWQLARRLAAPADWVMLVQSGQLPSELRTAWPDARHTLMLGPQALSGGTGLMLTDAAARMRAEIEVLGQELAEMELELATAQGELSAFTERYHADIGWRMAELDRLQVRLAKRRMRRKPDDPRLDAEARAAETRADQSRRENEQYQASRDKAEERFAPSNDLKKRYRQLAQRIHPDRARDEADRSWRTQLMSEANRAYRRGDADALDEILSLWLEGHNANSGNAYSVSSASTSSSADALVAQAERIRQRIAAISAELDRLYGSKLYELYSAARVATRQGRDLLLEMADRLDLQIEAAQAELNGQEEAVAA